MLFAFSKLIRRNVLEHTAINTSFFVYCQRVGSRCGGHPPYFYVSHSYFCFNVVANFRFVATELSDKGIHRFLSGATNVLAKRYSIQQFGYVGWLDNLKKLVGSVPAKPFDSRGCVVYGYALFQAKCRYLFQVESLVGVYKYVFVVEENKSHDTPHVVLRVWVVELHAPACFGRRKTAEHKQSCIVGQEWL